MATEGVVRDLVMAPSVHLYRMLADLTLALHVAFVLFVVGGQALIAAGWMSGWRWTRMPGVEKGFGSEREEWDRISRQS